jgi:cytosol aminopeptidase family protein
VVELAVITGEITSRKCDLLVLKHADAFYGADALVARKIGYRSGIERGEINIVRGTKDIGAANVAFVGVGKLEEFRYRQIRDFGRSALRVAANLPEKVRTLCMTIHGPGYGLDERESFLSLIGGLLDSIRAGDCPTELVRIEIVELSEKRASRLRDALSIHMSVVRTRIKYDEDITLEDSQVFTLSGENKSFASFGLASEKKPKIFVAMPNADEHVDFWEVAVQDAAKISDVLCERLDKEAFTGDVI